MHFDEVYHPRTATEFLQDWRYGISHDIYEWTHPHMAKYAMALGIVAFGEDRVGATSDLGVAVVDAAIEPRRDDGQDARADRGRPRCGSPPAARSAPTTSATRELAASIPLPGAVACRLRPTPTRSCTSARGRARSGSIDTTPLDLDRGRGPPVDIEPYPWTTAMRRSRSCS